MLNNVKWAKQSRAWLNGQCVHNKKRLVVFTGLLRTVWKLDVLMIIRVFWWRVLLGILPNYATLTNWHVRVQSTCSVCKSASALLECSHARPFWSAAKCVFHLKLPLLHPDMWEDDILCDSVFAKWECEIIISNMAAIWDSRNKWAHDDHETLAELEKKATTAGLYLVQPSWWGHQTQLWWSY
jgi:hypothetical protein